MQTLKRILIPSTQRGRIGVLIQVIGLFLVFFWFSPKTGLDNRLFSSVLAVLLVWLVPMWIARAVLLYRGLLPARG
jgi:hypothetical protein